MPLLSVKVFNGNNIELNSTVSISRDHRIYELIPLIGRLAREAIQKEQTHGLIINDQLIVFCTINDLMLVSIATRNTSFQRVESFLKLLREYLSNHLQSSQALVSSKDFQDLCNSIVKTIDDSTKEIKISLLGLDRSGKTTFLNFLREEQPLTGFESYKPTQLLDIIRIDSISNLPQIQFIDLGYAFRQHWWRFSNESDAYIFFVDSSDSNRIKKSQELFKEIRNFWDRPFVIAANMRDVSKIVNIRKYLARKFSISSKKIYETNTWTGDGIFPLLEGLITEEMRKIQIAPIIHSNKRET